MSIVVKPVSTLRASIIASAFALTACSDGPSGPAPIARIDIAPTPGSMVAGTTQLLTATPKDAKGQALSGRAIRWSSSNTDVASIGSSGLLTAVAPGNATITASSEGQAGGMLLQVLPVPVASVQLSASTLALVVGGAQSLTARPLDAAGALLTGRTVTWTSTNPAVATVDAVGTVSAIAPGSTTVTATSEGQSASATVSVNALPDAPVITGVSSSTLAPGASVTLTGIGFEPVAAANSVSVGGVPAQVVSASPTQLAITVPCVESGTVAIRASVRGVTSAPVTRPMTVPARTLTIGQPLILSSNAPSLCNELRTTSPNARYLVTVFSASTSPNSLADFELVGNTPPAGELAPDRVAPTAALRVETAVDPLTAQQSAAEAAHWEALERNRRDYDALMAKARALPASARRAAFSAPRVRARTPVVGDLRDFYYTFSAGCADTTRVMSTRAIHVGTRAVIWEDTANTLQSASNPALAGYYERLGRIYDEDQHQALKSTFGDPLLRDAVTDNDGLIHMVFSQRVNGTSAAAFVTTCDQFPRSISLGGNLGEVFYGAVPTNTSSNLSSTSSPDGWFYFMARTVVHEVKHIVSLAARVANDAPAFEQSWLEEGTARHAEEVWIRQSLHKVPWKANTGFGTAATNGVYCDFHPADAVCNAADPLRRPSYGMRRQFNEIRAKLLQPWNWSPYGDGTGQSGSVFYQTTWSLVRYAIDRYGASDADFFRALINASTNGVSNLSTVAGVPMDQLIGGWGLALFADDYPGLTAPSRDIQFPTWNLRSIYAGLNAAPNWTGVWSSPFPIQPAQLEFGSFRSRVTGLRGGAHAYFELSGPAAPSQLLAIRAVNGGAPSANLRLAIVRLQ